MKIEYTYNDARLMEIAYRRLPQGNSQHDKACRFCFTKALKMCGVKFLEWDIGKGRKQTHAFRVYAPDGKVFLQEKIDACRKQTATEKTV